MEVRETDRLFRDKLKNAPTAPRAGSWEKLESMLDEQDKAPLFTIRRVAAAVLLLMVSGLVVFFWTKDTKAPEQIAAIEQPSETIQDNHTIAPIIATQIPEEKNTVVFDPEGVSESKEIKPKSVENSKAPLKIEKVEAIEPPETTAPVKVEETQLAQAEISTPEVGEISKKKKFKSIKITYKRGNMPEPKPEEMIAKQRTDTTGGNKIKELWAQTKELNPGDIWADIRDAKDNLFQRNSKKNNVKNLNK